MEKKAHAGAVSNSSQGRNERPFGEVYNTFKKQGIGKYVCAGCDTELFSSNEKFDSKCGWPSFYDPSKAKNVKTSVDYLLGYPRTEVLCAVCDGHLGHVFTGEGFDTPTDKRYCINGTVLKIRAKPRKRLKSVEPVNLLNLKSNQNTDSIKTVSIEFLSVYPLIQSWRLTKNLFRRL